MITETILKPIGNGQYTFPQSWRKAAGFDKKHVKASFKNNKIIIEALEKEELDWDVRKISFEELNQETIDAIKESEKNYKAGNKDYFMSHDEFWQNAV